MNHPGYMIITASEADTLYGFKNGTVRKAISDGRVTSRKSAGTRLVTLKALDAAYGPPPLSGMQAFVAANLTAEDIAAWEQDQEISMNLQLILAALNLEDDSITAINGADPAKGKKHPAVSLKLSKARGRGSKE